jgi:cytochrome c
MKIGVPYLRPALIAAPCFVLLALVAAGFPSLAIGKVKRLSGNSVRGAALYQAKCSACHSLDSNRVGPLHRGVVGRKAGKVASFNYSPALQKSGIVWNQDTLDRWLSNPVAMVPGTRMGIRIVSAQDRSDIIAYLSAQEPRQ